MTRRDIVLRGVAQPASLLYCSIARCFIWCAIGEGQTCDKPMDCTPLSLHSPISDVKVKSEQLMFAPSLGAPLRFMSYGTWLVSLRGSSVRCYVFGKQVKAEQLAKETGELETLRQQLLQRERELSLKAAEQSSEGATLKVGLETCRQPRLLQPLRLGLCCRIAVGSLPNPACQAAGHLSSSHSRAAAGIAGAFL